MPTPQELQGALEQKTPSGFATYPTDNLVDKVIADDSFLGAKMQKAMDLGVTRQQALNYYSYGRTEGKPVEIKKEPSFFKQFSDVAQSPAKLFAGTIGKNVQSLADTFGLESLSEIAGQTESVRNFESNREDVGDFFRVALPVTAGVASAGASVPVMGAVSFTAGSIGAFIESLTDFERKEFDQIATDSLKEGGIDAMIDIFTFGAARGFRAVRNLRKGKPVQDQVDKVVGRIIQSKKAKDIKSATSALSELDTTGVKEFSDLRDIADTKIAALAKSQDDRLSQIVEKHTLEALEETVKVGEKEATRNPVSTALDHLEELYTKTGDTENMLKIQGVKEVAEREGLSVQEINQLARDYGVEFKSKAFSKAGDPLTSINAEMHENVRKQLKNTSRSLLPDNASKAIDDSMTNLFTVRDLSKTMTEKVQNLSNRIEDRGLMAKVSAKLGGGIDVALGRSPSNLFTSLFVRGNIGQKSLNALQIEEGLSKNLGKLDDLLLELSDATDAEATNILIKFIRKNNLIGTSLKTFNGDDQ